VVEEIGGMMVREERAILIPYNNYIKL